MDLDGLLVRQVLVCASGSVYWIGVLLLAAVLRRRTGRTSHLVPYGVKERVLWTGWLLVIVAWIAQPLLLLDLAELPLFALIPPCYGWVGLVVGTLLAVVGQLGTYWCYWAMGDSWRVGLERDETIQLVTRGPYAWVRHPIYGFQSMMLVGAACLLPTALSGLTIVLQLLCSYFKALDEERHLAQQLGATFLSYQSRTGRLWPRIASAAVEQGATG